MSNINYSKHSKTVQYGKYTKEYVGPGESKTNVIKSINKATFYKLFISLNNVIGVRQLGAEIIETRLSPAPLELLIHLLNKDEDFTIIFRNKKAVMKQLADELGKSPSSIYGTIAKLRETGYIIKDEDNLLTLNKELRDLKKGVEYCLSRRQPLTFDFIFKFCVVHE